jgi:L-lactate dehydrogenase complex protein LldE
MAERVSLFVTCIVDQVFPQIGVAMVEVLERLGYELDFPERQTCCGQPAFNSGYHAEARAMALHFLDTFEKCERIVVPSGSCAAMALHHFAELFVKAPETLARVHALEKRLWEFSAFLTDVAHVVDVGARFEGSVTYHDGCHTLRSLGIKDGPRRLLSHVRGLELRELDPAFECCGFGGTFAVKFGEISGSMAQAKAEAVLRTGADAVVSLDPSCLMQIRGALSRMGSEVRALHLAEVLASR